MTIVGAQDFQSGEQWQSQLILSDSRFLVAGTNHVWPDTGPATFAVANWQGTQVKVNAASVADWVFRWWADAAGLFQLGERRFSTSAVFTDTYLTLANLGPFLTIQAYNNAAGNNTASFSIVGTNRILAPFQPGSSGSMIAVAPQAVGAVSSVTVNAAYLYAGTAFVRLITGAAAWLVTLQAATTSGATIQVAEWSNAGVALNQEINQMVILPPQPVSVLLNNQDGAIRNFYFTLTPDMFR